MDRIKKTGKGMTLLELMIAVALLCVMFFTAMTILVNFRRFFYNFTGAMPSLMDTAGAFEDMTSKIILSNKVTILSSSATDSSIELWVDNTDPSVSTDDTVYTYSWTNSTNALKRKSNVGSPGGTNTSIAVDVTALTFTLQPVADPAANRVKMKLVAQPGNITETMVTTAVARGRSAQ